MAFISLFGRFWLTLAFFLNSLLLPLSAAGDISAEVTKIDNATNASLLWGPYRPNVYFGVRPRIPKSLLMGLMWVRVEDYQTVQQNFRHTCEQHELDGYGWDEYDARTGGRETIRDPGNMIDLTIDFAKVPGGQYGGNWGARIKGTLREDAPPNLKSTIFFYTALEGDGKLRIANEKDTAGYEGTVTLEGETPDLGRFKIDVTEGPKSNTHPSHGHPSGLDKPLDRTLARSFVIPEDALWQVKPILFAHLKQSLDGLLEKYGQENFPPPCQVYTVDNEIGEGTLHLVQKVFEGPFEFDILFSSASEDPMTSDVLTKQIKHTRSDFAKRFPKVFELAAPYNAGKYQQFAKSLFSNLAGGIGYFYGGARVDRSYDAAYEEEDEGFWEEAAEARARNEPKLLEGPYELFTSIPSRSFFPRGFLWDEGFHLLPIIDWDIDLTLDIVKSWFKLMDEDGWIGREQILGDEARSKVPPEFQTQYPHYANPPTLFFVLSEFLDRIEGKAPTGTKQEPISSAETYAHRIASRDVALEYLRELYPLLKRHYFWFRKTQSGDLKSYDREAFSTKEGYRWRGRTPKHILTSGLDDYPRAQPPHPGELHVDLISWIGMMTRSLKRIAKALGQEDDITEFEGFETAILRNIDDLHWDEKAKTYCDSSIDDYEEPIHVCHKGYISISPFMVGLLPTDSPKLGAILDLISNKEELWSDHGIRSLSKSDELYGTDENYWRGPVWINMNYLILKELLNLARSSGPHQKRAAKIYTELRQNVADTVYKSWKDTGFAWEQYDPETGAGQRTQHFTGWTSLVVKIMAMPDLSGGKARARDEL